MTDNKRVIMGCDHAAFDLKERIKTLLMKKGYAIEDVGTQGPESVDYPEYGAQVASRVASGEFTTGILMCGTGLGMSYVANRFKKVRAALCNDLFAATMSRRHNDANILVMGARVIGTDLAAEIVRTFFSTPFDGGRHRQRIDQIDQAN